MDAATMWMGGWTIGAIARTPGYLCNGAMLGPAHGRQLPKRPRLLQERQRKVHAAGAKGPPHAAQPAHGDGIGGLRRVCKDAGH